MTDPEKAAREKLDATWREMQKQAAMHDLPIAMERWTRLNTTWPESAEPYRVAVLRDLEAEIKRLARDAAGEASE